MKRESCRAIVFTDDKLVVMYREKHDRVYYTFPGGGLEENETLETCVKRECLEEFGIEVEPIKEAYIYEDEKTKQHFFLVKWIGGEMGSGVGEEFQPETNRGIYVPTLMPVNKMEQLPLMPPEVVRAMAQDIKEYGYDLAPQTKWVEGK